MTAARLAVVCDYLEEGWPSMDLVGDMVTRSLREGDDSLRVEQLRPAMRRRFRSLPLVGGRNVAFNADRLVGRFRDYPHYLRSRRREFDLFHLVDHSYSQLLHELPAGRTVVTCHDLDTFRSLLLPDREPRHRLYVAMAARVLSGFRTAARVVCVSAATAAELEASGVVPAERIRVITNGVHPSCRPEPDAADASLERLLPRRSGGVELLHVGSTIDRKRIDLLLRVFAEILRRCPAARLLRVGGAFTPEQEALAVELGVLEAVDSLPSLDRATLAAAYRRASLLLQPSEREGFGLPLIEALACGTPVLASDIPVFREVGADAVEFRAVGDVEGWAAAALALVEEREARPEEWAERRLRGLRRAGCFSWSEHARRLRLLYAELLAA